MTDELHGRPAISCSMMMQSTTATVLKCASIVAISVSIFAVLRSRRLATPVLQLEPFEALQEASLGTQKEPETVLDDGEGALKDGREDAVDAEEQNAVDAVTAAGPVLSEGQGTDSIVNGCYKGQVQVGQPPAAAAAGSCCCRSSGTNVAEVGRRPRESISNTYIITFDDNDDDDYDYEWDSPVGQQVKVVDILSRSEDESEYDVLQRRRSEPSNESSPVKERRRACETASIQLGPAEPQEGSCGEGCCGADQPVANGSATKELPVDRLNGLPSVCIADYPRTKVIFGSETGTAQRLAEKLYQVLLDKNFPVELVNAAVYEPEDLSKERLVLFILSTWEDGRAPKNAAFLANWLEESAKDFRVGAGLLCECRFCSA